MSLLRIDFNWKLRGQLHIGSGIGRVGYADSVFRTAGDGERPIIPGDAVKGAIREGAERLLHWLWPGRPTDRPSTSFPDHPILRDLFASQPHKIPFYRFSAGKLCQAGFIPMRTASTAIENSTGTAVDTTLRVVETLAPEYIFKVTISGEGGEWHIKDASDRQELYFLLASLLALESIGGKKGVGHGELAVQDLKCMVDQQDILNELIPNGRWTEEMIKMLKEHVQRQRGEGRA